MAAIGHCQTSPGCQRAQAPQLLSRPHQLLHLHGLACHATARLPVHDTELQDVLSEAADQAPAKFAVHQIEDCSRQVDPAAEVCSYLVLLRWKIGLLQKVSSSFSKGKGGYLTLCCMLLCSRIQQGQHMLDSPSAQALCVLEPNIQGRLRIQSWEPGGTATHAEARVLKYCRGLGFVVRAFDSHKTMFTILHFLQAPLQLHQRLNLHGMHLSLSLKLRFAFHVTVA